jgi:hypothetical protein
MKRLLWATVALVGSRWAMQAWRNRSQSKAMDNRIHDLQDKFRSLDETREPAERFGTWR